MTEKVCPHCGRKLPGDKEPKYYIANNGKIIKAFSISHIWQNCERCEMAAGPYHLFVKNIRRIWSDQPQKADYDLTATGKEAKS